ncbi:MAG TPA: quinone oxidoreductase, partial [Ignavibacteria bacterium]|nr:quinone oxidoreductase [Ignavibacteria bacterium]
MKAIVIHELGDSSKLKYEETEIPKIKEDEILIKQEAVGLNFVDIYFRTGLYKSKLPFIPGQEGAGIVEEIGTKVKDFKQEDRVVYLGVMGSYAEFIKIPVIKAVKLPDEISTKNAAALMLQGLTAHYLTHSTYPLKKGDSCLIHAAAGGVGLLLTQIAKITGAFVIGTTSTLEKAQLAKKAGCDEVIIYSKND